MTHCLRKWVPNDFSLRMPIIIIKMNRVLKNTPNSLDIFVESYADSSQVLIRLPKLLYRGFMTRNCCTLDFVCFLIFRMYCQHIECLPSRVAANFNLCYPVSCLNIDELRCTASSSTVSTTPLDVCVI